MPEQLEGTPAASSQPTQSPNSGSGLHESLLQSLRALCSRQEDATDAGAKRPRLTEGEMDALVRAATLVREQCDQSQAPPVDYDLVHKATWNQLPNDLAEMVQGL